MIKQIYKNFTIRMKSFLDTGYGRLMLLFGIEGFFFQYIQAYRSFANNLYATNLGATDAQIGLISTVGNVAAVFLLIPVGIFVNKLKSPKPFLIGVLCFIGVMYCCFAFVPEMGENRMLFFYIFLALTAGVFVTYDAQWQNFFGMVVPQSDRNAVYSFRNFFVLFINMLTPLVCGIILSQMPDSEKKLIVLRVFYYIAALFLFLQAFVVSRIKESNHEENVEKEKFTLKVVLEAAKQMYQSKKYKTFFLTVILFYIGWHFDWSMWYIGQVKYCHMDEAYLSWATALAGAVQLLGMGFWSKVTQKKGVDFTIIFGALGLAPAPLFMIFCVHLPEQWAPMVLLILCSIISFSQGIIQLCLVQMLLEAAPEKNRAVIISLHTVLVTLSSTVVPLLGVRLYLGFGGDYHGLMVFMVCCAILRFSSVGVFLLRYLQKKRESAKKDNFV